MKEPIVAAVLNFFFMGPGIYNGKRALLGNAMFAIDGFREAKALNAAAAR